MRTQPGCWAGGAQTAVVGLRAGDDVLDVVSRMLSNHDPV